MGFLGVRTGDGRRVILPEGGEKRTASRGERDLASLGAFCLCVSKPFPSFHKGAKTPLFMSPLPNEGVRESQGERERGRERRKRGREGERERRKRGRGSRVVLHPPSTAPSLDAHLVPSRAATLGQRPHGNDVYKGTVGLFGGKGRPLIPPHVLRHSGALRLIHPHVSLPNPEQD